MVIQMLMVPLSGNTEKTKESIIYCFPEKLIGCPGGGGVFLLRTTPDKGGGGGLENLYFWRTSFVNGPREVYSDLYNVFQVVVIKNDNFHNFSSFSVYLETVE